MKRKNPFRKETSFSLLLTKKLVEISGIEPLTS